MCSPSWQREINGKLEKIFFVYFVKEPQIENAFNSKDQATSGVPKTIE